jgi:hypothetical protein
VTNLVFQCSPYTGSSSSSGNSTTGNSGSPSRGAMISFASAIQVVAHTQLAPQRHQPAPVRRIVPSINGLPGPSSAVIGTARLLAVIGLELPAYLGATALGGAPTPRLRRRPAHTICPDRRRTPMGVLFHAVPAGGQLTSCQRDQLTLILLSGPWGLERTVWTPARGSRRSATTTVGSAVVDQGRAHPDGPVHGDRPPAADRRLSVTRPERARVVRERCRRAGRRPRCSRRCPP